MERFIQKGDTWPCVNNERQAGCSEMERLVFSVSNAPDGGFVARWNDPAGGGITTQGDDLADLQSMVTDAVQHYFDPPSRVVEVELDFKEAPVLCVSA